MTLMTSEMTKSVILFWLPTDRSTAQSTKNICKSRKNQRHKDGGLTLGVSGKTRGFIDSGANGAFGFSKGHVDGLLLGRKDKKEDGEEERKGEEEKGRRKGKDRCSNFSEHLAVC